MVTIDDFEPSKWVSKEAFRPQECRFWCQCSLGVISMGDNLKMHANLFFFVFFENSFVFLKMAATAKIDQEKSETFLSAYIGYAEP